ncbi:MAG TPA: DUF58 domain-containing protein [Thermoanaerobaculia bacterium]
MHPTRRCIAVAACGLPVALLPIAVHSRLWPFWPVYLGLFALAVGADALLSPPRRGVTCAVELPAALYIGEEGEAVLSLRLPQALPALGPASRAPGALPLTVAVDLSDRLVPQPPLAGYAEAGAAVLRCRLVPTRRGRVAVERAWVRFAGPLGLVESTVRVGLGAEAAVLPNILPVRSAALRFSRDRDFRAGLKIERYTGDGSEFDSLKELVHGDDPRAIDWKSTAHHRKLVVRQHRAERNHQVILAVDTGYLMCEPLVRSSAAPADAAAIPKVDHAVASALLLAYVSQRAGDRVGLFTFDARVGLYVEPQGGSRGFQALSRMASRIEYSENETNFTLGLTTLAQRLSRRSLVVVLTDFVDTITTELMIENLDRLAARHLIVFVALRDPGLGRIAAGAPADRLALNRAVVAGDLLRDREVVIQQLRRRGIRPIDAEPAEISTRLINAYLQIKRQERI